MYVALFKLMLVAVIDQPQNHNGLIQKPPKKYVSGQVAPSKDPSSFLLQGMTLSDALMHAK